MYTILLLIEIQIVKAGEVWYKGYSKNKGFRLKVLRRGEEGGQVDVFIVVKKKVIRGRA